MRFAFHIAAQRTAQPRFIMLYLRLIAFMALAWWPMMAIHESGHILGALATGATIERVVLWPWTISETARTSQPAPLVDTAAGPIVGALMPLLLFLLLSRWRPRCRIWLGFFAGFCLIANGLYLGVGWIDAVGDAGDLLRLGVPLYALIGAGAFACAAGLHVWHLTFHRIPPSTSRGEMPAKLYS